MSGSRERGADFDRLQCGLAETNATHFLVSHNSHWKFIFPCSSPWMCSA